VFLIAVVSSIIGIGGGVIFVPLFLFIGSFSMKEAAPLSLFIILGVSSVSTLSHHQKKRLDLKTGLFLQVFMIIGAVGGTYVNTYLSEATLRLMFGIILLLVGIRSVHGVKHANESPSLPTGESYITNLSWERKTTIITLVFLAGVASGSFGIGGGPLVVPLLVHGVGMPMTIAAGTSQLLIVFASLLSAFTYYIRGQLELGHAVYFILAGSLGAYLSTRISIERLDSKQLSMIFASCVVLIGLFMLLGTYQSLNLT